MKYLVLILFFVLPEVGFAQIPPPPPPPPKRKVPKPQIQDFPDVEAKYPGGTRVLLEDIENTIVYPETAKKEGIQGRVYVSFVVEITGKVSSVKILRGIDSECDKEAIRVVKNLKKWIPAENKGQKVRQLVKLPITFTLD